ncbi:MAG: zinc ribbon domain-containing protein [Candidatus Omnitrophica bacterium]|nr:zinc ribbon domain-containing protein [Candidatus Omnitrophota bacterium]
MPHYDYECKKCGHKFEVFQKITDKPQKRCPKCRSAARRLIAGGAGLIFKGSGFYATDYKKNNKKDVSCKGVSPGSAKDKSSCASCPNGHEKSSKPDSCDKAKKD